MWSASRDYLMLAQEVLTRLKVKPITKTKGEGARVVGESVGEVPVTVGARPLADVHERLLSEGGSYADPHKNRDKWSCSCNSLKQQRLWRIIHNH
jgi:hypothetical protein